MYRITKYSAENFVKMGNFESKGILLPSRAKKIPQERARSRLKTKEGAVFRKKEERMQRCDAVTKQNVLRGKLKYFRQLGLWPESLLGVNRP